MEPTVAKKRPPPSEPQSVAAVLMVRPASFTSNRETLASNAFQRPARAGALADRARAEWGTLADALAARGVAVRRYCGRADLKAPDEVFPNNWVSFHGDGTVVLYPLLAPSRRRERRADIIAALEREHGYRVTRIVDLSALEQRGLYLEGTGSLVLDRVHRVAYACLSPRTSTEALTEFADRLGYEVVAFPAFDTAGVPVYHTNVMLAIGTRFALLASGAIADPEVRRAVLARLASTGRG